MGGVSLNHIQGMPFKELIMHKRLHQSGSASYSHADVIRTMLDKVPSVMSVRDGH